MENFQNGIKNFKMKKANATATHIAKAPRANAPTKALSKSVSVQPKKDQPFCKNLNSYTHPSTDKNKLTITAELKRHNYLTDKNRQCITKCICHKGFSRYSSVVARSNFRVGGQITTTQSLTAHTLDRCMQWPKLGAFWPLGSTR